MTELAVIDHGAGNLVSIARGLERAGARVRVVAEPEQMGEPDGVVLPGVGATLPVMRRLEATGLDQVLRALDRPLLGICVGLQILFDWSNENGHDCLGLLSGDVVALDSAPSLPHMGWNAVRQEKSDPLFEGVEDSALFYFVHSFAPRPGDPDTAIATTEHGRRFTSAARAAQVVGVQFHPERSGAQGLRVLANFVELCRAA